MLSAIDRNHCPPSNGTPVRHHRNTQAIDDEAKALTAEHKKNWVHPIDDLPAQGGG
jgi:hypothetical protein